MAANSKRREEGNVLKIGDARVFIQVEGINPENEFVYMGWTSMGEFEQEEGEPEPIYAPSYERRNDFDIIDETAGQQALGSVDFTAHANRFLRDEWIDLKGRRCNFNMKVLYGRCQQPDNIDDWDAQFIIRRARITSFTIPGANPLSADDNGAGDYTGSISYHESVPVRRLTFGERGQTPIFAQVLDGFYNDEESCGECGPSSNGCKKSFWLTGATGGSPGLSSQLVYSVDGQTYEARDITPLGGASGNAMVPVGPYVVIFEGVTNSHIIIPTDDLVAGAGTFTQVTTGYVSAKVPRKAWSKSSNRTYVAADGGYIYLMKNPTRGVTVLADGSASTQNLADIHGLGSVVVAVGGSNAVLHSRNDGQTFNLVTGPAVGVDLTSVWVMTRYTWFVGTADGKLYFTNDEGVNWTEIALDSDVVSVNDIQFVNDAIGYLAVRTTSGGRLYETTTGGNTWADDKPRLDKLPDNYTLNVVAACGPNIVAVGGARVNNGDGMLAVAS